MSKETGKPRAYMRMAITTNEVIALINDTALKIHEIIGDSVSCNRINIDLYKPIIRSFMMIYCQQSTMCCMFTFYFCKGTIFFEEKKD